MQLWYRGKHVGDIPISNMPSGQADARFYTFTEVVSAPFYPDEKVPVIYMSINLPVRRRHIAIDKFALEHGNHNAEDLLRRNGVPIGESGLKVAEDFATFSYVYSWDVVEATSPEDYESIFDHPQFTPV